MGKKIQAIRGMNDCLPEHTVLWQLLEDTLKQVLVSYGYREIRLPIVEHTQLFKRAIGEITEVVEKEMYSFVDRNGDSLTLRPEGTASCVRASIEHGLLYNQEQRLWYIGPMFRHERPQKGRYRQFHQLGAEVFGQPGPEIDAELMILTARWWRLFGISEQVSLELNSIGSRQARHDYSEALVAFLKKHLDHLDQNCRRSIQTNPMRVLDMKNANIQILLNTAPVLSDYIDDDSRDHFNAICKLLDLAGIPYTVNPRLVRGLDYYNRTVFEWVTTSLGSQGTVCAGGRYDGLVEQLGGRATSAVGLALGLERLVLLVQEINQNFTVAPHVDAYLVTASDSDDVQIAAMLLAEQIRDALPSLRLMTNYGGGRVKTQLSRADKHGASVALIVGPSEAATQQVIVKTLTTGNQETWAQCDVATRLASLCFKTR